MKLKQVVNGCDYNTMSLKMAYDCSGVGIGVGGASQVFRDREGLGKVQQQFWRVQLSMCVAPQLLRLLTQ